MTRRIAIIGAGGTIAMEGAHAFDWVDYGDNGIIRPVDEVVMGLDFRLPEIEIVPHPFAMLPGTGVLPSHWVALRREVVQLAESGQIDGIVITHGTATLEDTAFFLRASLSPSIPVVVTGSQRPPNTASSDTVAGLRAALIAAASAPPGIYVAMNAMLFSADDVTKTANHALDAFEAPEFGPIGRIEAAGTLSLKRPLLPAPAIFPVTDAAILPRVDVVQSYAGADGTAIRAFVAAGAKAIISAGFPPGRCTPLERQALLDAVAAGLVVVQGSRALRGHVPLQRYNAVDGILSGGGLSVGKSRILVMLALAHGADTSSLQQLLLAW